MNWGLFVLYLFAATSLGAHLVKHGEYKFEKYNFWGTLLAFIIQFILIWWALGWRFI